MRNDNSFGIVAAFYFRNKMLKLSKLERFLFECRKTKTKVITLANQ